MKVDMKVVLMGLKKVVMMVLTTVDLMVVM